MDTVEKHDEERCKLCCAGSHRQYGKNWQKHDNRNSADDDEDVEASVDGHIEAGVHRY